MLTVSKVNLAQEANQISISNNQQKPYSIKTHSQPMKDTVSFKALPVNFGVVVEGKLFRGGSILAKNISELIGRNIKFVMDLTSSVDEAQILKEVGINHIPITFGNPSTPKVLGELKIIADKIAELMNQGAVYIHCDHGKQRTGAAVWSLQHFIQKTPADEILAHGELHKSTDIVKLLNRYVEFMERMTQQNK